MSASPLESFEAELRRRIGTPARPFVCDGSPLTCKVVLVGSNPADAAGLDFWRFWDAGEGFRRAAWRDAYARAKADAGKGGESMARRMLDRIATAAAPARVLETNVDPRTPELVGFLFAAVRPAVVVAHGSAAAAHLRRALMAEVPGDRFARIAGPWGGVYARAVPHLARGWSYAAADALGREIQALATR